MINSGRTVRVALDAGCCTAEILSLWKCRDLTKLHWALAMINLLQSLARVHEALAWEQLSTHAVPRPSSRPQQGGGDTLPRNFPQPKNVSSPLNSHRGCFL